jgi:hypothetical protein
MARIHPYSPSVPVVMRLLKNGSITVAEAAEVLQCSTRQITKIQAEFGIVKPVVYSGLARKEASEANRARKELLEKLAKQVKYEKGDLHALAAENNIPSRTLYRWVHRV